MSISTGTFQEGFRANQAEIGWNIVIYNVESFALNLTSNSALSGMSRFWMFCRYSALEENCKSWVVRMDSWCQHSLVIRLGPVILLLVQYFWLSVMWDHLRAWVTNHDNHTTGQYSHPGHENKARRKGQIH